jgi:hypothetical protein
MLGRGGSPAVGSCDPLLPRLFGEQRRQPFEVTCEIGIIDLGEIAAFERISPSFDFGA